jgi:muramoyltetrapeptide carboxypeptidase
MGFFAPSGYLPDPAVMDRAAQYLSGHGWRVSAGESVFAREQRFAGPDALRASELQRFTTDPSLDVAVAARGGYGLSRILDQIDYSAVVARGLPVVGYSDFTAFNLALLARAGGVSFQGPTAVDFSGLADSAFTMEHFFGAISQSPYTVEFETVDASGAGGLDAGGRLWGGNLAMVCALLGTPYFPQVRGGILFLEDVNEPTYRIERMLLQLLQADILQRQKAILLGDFLSIPSMPNDGGFDLAAVWTFLRSRLSAPLITGLPFGHGRRRLTLPVGAQARLSVRGKRAQLQFRGHPTLRTK